MQDKASTASTLSSRLDRIFRARSVALIGVSGNAHKLNGAPLAILQKTGFAGKIYPVNPKYGELGGVPCYPSIEALPEPADVALVMVAADEVIETVAACGRKGMGSCIVFTSGFEEVEGGRELAAQLAETARAADMPVVGPNCEGVWSVKSRVLMTFGSAARREHLHHAPIAILGQSGAITGSIARHLQDSAIGCAYVVSVGNETVLNVLDYLEWIIEQDDVKVVLMFIEGLNDGARLLQLAARARARSIQLVALKSGNSVIGQAAAASHTGKIASSYAVYRDVLDQAGVIQVESLTDLIEAAEVFTFCSLPPRRGVAGGVSVFSVPGGTRALTADLCETHGIPLAVFASETVAALKKVLPAFGQAENPTDLTAMVLSDHGMFDASLKLVANDPNTEALIIQFANRGPLDVVEKAESLKALVRQLGVPAILTFLGDRLAPEVRRGFLEAGVLSARDAAEATRFLSWMYKGREIVSRPATVAAKPVQGTVAPTTWEETAGFLQQAGIGMPAWRILQPADDIAAACAGLKFPVVVKALPSDSDHKTEMGLVLLSVPSAVAVVEAAATIRQRLGKAAAGVLVQEMVPGGVEAVLSVIRNPDFGPVLVIGTGGIAVELFCDIGYLAFPVTREQVRALVGRLKLSTLLAGFRGKPAADTEALIDAALGLAARFSACAASDDSLQEIELNPVFVMPGKGGVLAVDALVKILPAA